MDQSQMPEMSLFQRSNHCTDTHDTVAICRGLIRADSGFLGLKSTQLRANHFFHGFQDNSKGFQDNSKGKGVASEREGSVAPKRQTRSQYLTE